MSWNLHLVSRFSRLRNHQPPCSLLGKFRDTSSVLRCNRVFSKTVRRREISIERIAFYVFVDTKRRTDDKRANKQQKVKNKKIEYLTIFNSVANLQILYYI